MTVWPVEDLHDRLRLGLARGETLLTADEQDTIERVLALDGDPALLVARLVGRQRDVHRVPDLSAAGVEDVPTALTVLAANGLVDLDPPWDARAVAASRPVLVDGCRRAGLPRGGRRAELVERLEGRTGWDDAAWTHLAARDVLLRVERMGTLQVHPDRARAVLARMGTRAWPEYPLTGTSLVPDRGSWDRWEGLVARWDLLTRDEALAALAWPHWPPGALDLRDALGHALRDLARRTERAGEPLQAAALWEALVVVDAGGRDHVVRRARCLERAGDEASAWTMLCEGHHAAHGVARVAIARAGRRMAKARRTAWIPDPPLTPAPTRSLRMDREGLAGHRPTYATPGGATTVEAATVEALARAGRKAVHAESGVWSTLLTLLFCEAMWAPVPGQLPVPYLSGPLDAGTPAFAERRADLVGRILADVDAEQTAVRVTRAWETHQGQELSGVSWDLVSLDELVSAIDDLGPTGVRALAEPWLRGGRRALGGLPDLVVVRGPEVVVAGLHPSTLDGRTHLVEVKGESDTLRDGQRVWLDRFVRAGVSAGVWHVVAR